jgi:hypothetical protein
MTGLIWLSMGDGWWAVVYIMVLIFSSHKVWETSFLAEDCWLYTKRSALWS